MRGTRSYLARLYRQFDMVMAPSRLMVQQLAEMGIAGAVHQPLGIDLDVFRPQRRIGTLRQHLHLPPDARLLVYAGRFTADKKLDAADRRGAQAGPALPPGAGRRRRARCRTIRRSATSRSSATSACWRACWPAAT